MLKKLKLPVSIVASIAFFFVLVKFMVSFGTAIFGVSPITFAFDHVAALFVVYGLITVLFFVNLFQLLNQKISKILIRLEMIVYFVSAFCLIMFKSFGIRGINFNPLDIFTTIAQSPMQILFNIFIFIPAGAYLFVRFKKIKILLLGLLVIILMEISQYIFALGVADIVDVLTNFFGLYIGYIFFDSLQALSFAAHSEGGYYILEKTRSL